MDLLSTYNRLSRPEKLRAWWYAAIIFTPVAAVILASLWFGPGLDRLAGLP